MNGVFISSSGCGSQFDRYNQAAELTDLEKKAVEYIKSAFFDADLNFEELRFIRMSDNYLTILAPNDTDFCRLKASNRSSWFSVAGVYLPDSLKIDPRFDGIKKSLLHWKIKLNGVDDLKNNSDIIIETYIGIKKE